jgi:hypothetical protein
LINERFPDHDITVIPDASGQATSSKNFSESAFKCRSPSAFRICALTAVIRSLIPGFTPFTSTLNDHDITVIPDASGQATSSKNFSESDHAILKKNGFKVEVNGVNPGIKDRITAVNAQILNAEGERHLN